MKKKTTKIPLEGLLKYADWKNKQKDEEIGRLKYHIDELEDAEKREVRIRYHIERVKEVEYTEMKRTIKKLRERINIQKNTIDNLMAKLNKYER